MHCHCGVLQTRGETRCPGGVSVSCLEKVQKSESPKLCSDIDAPVYLSRHIIYHLFVNFLLVRTENKLK